MKRFIRPIARACARAASLLAGLGLVALLPVQLWVQRRRDISLATGHVPHMDPGVMMSVAAFMVLLPLAIILLIEAARCWVLDQRALSWSGYFTLGVLSGWPIGLGCTGSAFHEGYPTLLLATALSVLPFYVATWESGERRAVAAAG